MMGFDGQGMGFGKKLFGSGKSYEQKIFGDWKLDQFPRDLGRGARALVGNGRPRRVAALLAIAVLAVVVVF